MNYSLHGVVIACDFELPGVPRTARAAEMSMVRGSRSDDQTIQPFHQWCVTDRRRAWLQMAHREDGYLLRFPGMVDVDVSAGGDRVVYRPAPRLPLSTLVHLLLDQVVPLAISRRGSLALHASAVHVPRCGTIAFVGAAGSGKSTLAAAMGLAGCEVVTDDCLVVDVGRGCVAAAGYRGLRLWNDAASGLGVRRESETRVAHYTAKRRLTSAAIRFRATPSPLKALFLLGRRRTNGLETRRTVLGARERLMSLASCVYVLDIEDRRQLAQMFRGLTSLASLVPVARLNVREGRRQAREAAAEVLTIARSLTAGA